jgi:hypothetical protein
MALSVTPLGMDRTSKTRPFEAASRLARSTSETGRPRVAQTATFHLLLVRRRCGGVTQAGGCPKRAGRPSRGHALNSTAAPFWSPPGGRGLGPLEARDTAIYGPALTRGCVLVRWRHDGPRVLLDTPRRTPLLKRGRWWPGNSS